MSLLTSIRGIYDYATILKGVNATVGTVSHNRFEENLPSKYYNVAASLAT